MATPIHDLLQSGQSPWYDGVPPGGITPEGIAALIARGVRGITINPAIFEKAVAAGTQYDGAIARMASRGMGAPEIYEALLVADVAAAADLFRPIYDESEGQDGFVSIEVSPLLAHDTAGTIAEARRFWHTIARPNVMVKVPATDEGIPAITRLTADGINVNVTLIFGLAIYERVMEAYMAGLEQVASGGKPLERVASVASFFVSRVDVEVDRRLDEVLHAERAGATQGELAALHGAAAIANARLAYHRFRRAFAGARFAALHARGGRVQRPLWASTGTKNPSYRDVRYVEELIGPRTVTTLAPATLDAFEDHGRVARTIDADVDDAYRVLDGLEATGIRIQDVADTLLAAGIAAFDDSLTSLYALIEQKGALPSVPSR